MSGQDLLRLVRPTKSVPSLSQSLDGCAPDRAHVELEARRRGYRVVGAGRIGHERADGRVELTDGIDTRARRRRLSRRSSSAWATTAANLPLERARASRMGLDYSV